MYIYGDGTHRQQIVTHPNLLPIKVFQCYILDTVVVDCVVYCMASTQNSLLLMLHSISHSATHSDSFSNKTNATRSHNSVQRISLLHTPHTHNNIHFVLT